MRHFLIFSLIVFSGSLHAQMMVTTGGDPKVGVYNLGAEFQVGYPNVKLTNPNGKDAIYDGVAIRGNLNVPIYRGAFDLHLSPGGKYLDLKNVANTSSQVETANVIGIGAGLTVRYKYVQFGAKYFQEWSRHYTSGPFSSRVNYDMSGIEYFGGLYFRFDRLGLGLSYSNQISEIDKADSGLNSNTPYNETIYSLQFTFDLGESMWQLLGRLF